LSPELWLPHLEDKEKQHRLVALRTLSGTGSALEVQKLHMHAVMHCVDDAEHTVRREALLSIGRLKWCSAGCVPILCDKLEDPDMFVRAAAVQVLADFVLSADFINLTMTNHLELASTRVDGQLDNKGSTVGSLLGNNMLLTTILQRQGDQCVGVRIAAKRVIDKVWPLMASMLIQRLDHLNEEVRQKAAMWLVPLGQHAAVHVIYLVCLLAHATAAVRTLVADVLVGLVAHLPLHKTLLKLLRLVRRHPTQADVHSLVLDLLEHIAPLIRQNDRVHLTFLRVAHCCRQSAEEQRGVVTTHCLHDKVERVLDRLAYRPACSSNTSAAPDAHCNAPSKAGGSEAFGTVGPTHRPEVEVRQPDTDAPQKSSEEVACRHAEGSESETTAAEYSSTSWRSLSGTVLGKRIVTFACCFPDTGALKQRVRESECAELLEHMDCAVHHSADQALRRLYRHQQQVATV
jgi:HEAT repeat protein